MKKFTIPIIDIKKYGGKQVAVVRENRDRPILSIWLSIFDCPAVPRSELCSTTGGERFTFLRGLW